MNTFLKKHGSLILAIITVLGVYVLLQAVGVTCPIKFLTGISCAGCGMTRAWMNALKLDFTSAIFYHPLFLAVPPAAFFLMMKKRLPNISKVILSLIAALFLIVYLFRMINADCTVVSFDPKNGLIYRIIHSII